MPTSPSPYEILLYYLGSPRVTVVPGADGITVEEVIDAYPLAVAHGQAPGPVELARRHPAADRLGEFFAARGWFRGRR